MKHIKLTLLILSISMAVLGCSDDDGCVGSECPNPCQKSNQSDTYIV